MEDSFGSRRLPQLRSVPESPDSAEVDSIEDGFIGKYEAQYLQSLRHAMLTFHQFLLTSFSPIHWYSGQFFLRRPVNIIFHSRKFSISARLL